MRSLLVFIITVQSVLLAWVIFRVPLKVIVRFS